MVPSNDHFRPGRECCHPSARATRGEREGREADSPARLLEHVEHLGLEDMVDRFDCNGGTALGHGKDIDDVDLEEMKGRERRGSANDVRRVVSRGTHAPSSLLLYTTHGVLVNELSEHETHNLHWDSCPSVFEHLRGEGRSRRLSKDRRQQRELAPTALDDTP